MDRLNLVRRRRGMTPRRAWSSAALFLVLFLSACTGSGMDEDGHGGTDLEPDATFEVPTEPTTEDAPG